jgi:hypothetical protein
MGHAIGALVFSRHHLFHIIRPNKMYQTPRLSASLRDFPARSAVAIQSIRIPDRLVGVKEKTTPVFSITRERGFLPREVSTFFPF